MRRLFAGAGDFERYGDISPTIRVWSTSKGKDISANALSS